MEHTRAYAEDDIRRERAARDYLLDVVRKHADHVAGEVEATLEREHPYAERLVRA